MQGLFHLARHGAGVEVGMCQLALKHCGSNKSVSASLKTILPRWHLSAIWPKRDGGIMHTTLSKKKARPTDRIHAIPSAEFRSSIFWVAENTSLL